MSESDSTTRRTRKETRLPGNVTPRSRAASEIRPAIGPRSLVRSEYASGRAALKQAIPKRIVALPASAVSGMRPAKRLLRSAVTGR